ncbi:MAG: hypothetical protein Q7J16_10720 [Candidatus Cloacimonadales bacterium]|nr:hypothetical protein [Candidatus Cloacimonadales bacterium]
MKKILFAIFISSFFFSCSQHPALAIFRWKFQLEESNYVIPYTINLIALSEMQEAVNLRPIKNYLNWVFRNLNYPDKHGLTGSIYDFDISILGVETPSDTYDSVDSYSATFLMMLQKYFFLSQDRALIQQNKQKIHDIAYTIIYLQGEDGLTTALPVSDVKYLMDNCEVFGGLKAFIELSEEFGWNLEDYYFGAKDSVERGIMQKLYNAELQNFNWAVDDENIHTSDWHIFYPDAFAQLFPIIYGLLDDDAELRHHLWDKFNEIYKNQINIPAEQKIVIDFAEKRMDI